MLVSMVQPKSEMEVSNIFGIRPDIILSVSGIIRYPKISISVALNYSLQYSLSGLLSNEEYMIYRIYIAVFITVMLKDNIVTRLNIRVRYRNRLLSFHLTSKFR